MSRYFSRSRLAAAYALVAGLLLTAVLSQSLATAAQNSTAAAVSLPDSLEDHIDTLRCGGRFDEALAVAQELAAVLAEDPAQAPWRERETECLVATLRRAAELPAPEQTLLAAADCGNGEARSAFREQDYAGALAIVIRQLETRRRIWGTEHEDIAVCLNNLGTLYWQQGDLARAAPFLREALAMNRRIYGNEHPDIASNMHNLATVMRIQGHFNEAEELVRESLAMRRNLLPDDHIDIAFSLNNLAGLYIAQGDHARAEPALREVLDRITPVLGEDQVEVAKIRHNMGFSLLQQKKYAEAEELIEAALVVNERNQGQESRFVGGGHHSLANALRGQGKFAAAETHYEKALAIYRNVLGEQHPWIPWALGDLALNSRYQGRYAAAESCLIRAAEVFETARLRAGPGLERANFQTSPYRDLAAVRLLRGNGAAAWPAVERSLGRVLADLLVGVGQRALSPSEIAREDSLQRALSDLERELAALRALAPGDTTVTGSAQIEATRTRLMTAEAAWSSFQLRVAARHPVTEGQAYPLARVQAALDDGTALVGWLSARSSLTEKLYWAYVIRRTGPVHWIRLSADTDPQQDSDLADRADGFRESLSLAGTWPIRITDVTRIQNDARRLYEDSWEPLCSYLVGVEHLVIIASGPLLGLPVEAFTDSTGVALGDGYAVSYAPSATVYSWLREQKAPPKYHPERGALLLGDPPFTVAHLAEMRQEEADERLTARPPRSANSLEVQHVYMRDGLASDTALTELPRLPRTRQEVREISALLPRATTLVGPAASEQALVRLAESDSLRYFDIIHLATHAIVDDTGPERSALVLSRVGLPDPLETVAAGTRFYDGLLTVNEILREWRLEADLVVLSACRTALGKEATGEGYVGLAHAFLQAGARNLLVSLWPVDEEATGLLMERFYANLTGTGVHGGRDTAAMPTAEALREARCWLRDLRRADGTQPFRHPAYWSGFILLGE